MEYKTEIKEIDEILNSPRVQFLMYQNQLLKAKQQYEWLKEFKKEDTKKPKELKFNDVIDSYKFLIDRYSTLVEMLDLTQIEAATTISQQIKEITKCKVENLKTLKNLEKQQKNFENFKKEIELD